MEGLAEMAVHKCDGRGDRVYSLLARLFLFMVRAKHEPAGGSPFGVLK